MVPAHPLTRLLLAGAALGATVAGCSDGGTDDPQAFCAAYDDLRSEDPFAELDVASPGEMRSAFDDVAADADAIADAAPSDVRVQAERYRASVEDLLDQLRGAGFDPSQLDPLAYGRAADDYTDAAVSLDNAASSLCD